MVDRVGLLLELPPDTTPSPFAPHETPFLRPHRLVALAGGGPFPRPPVRGRSAGCGRRRAQDPVFLEIERVRAFGRFSMTGRPSAAEAVLLELAPKQHWELTLSKDGSLFSGLPGPVRRLLLLHHRRSLRSRHRWAAADEPRGKTGAPRCRGRRQRVHRHPQCRRYLPYGERAAERPRPLSQPWGASRSLRAHARRRVHQAQPAAVPPDALRRPEIPGPRQVRRRLQSARGVVFAEGLQRRPPRAAGAGD